MNTSLLFRRRMTFAIIALACGIAWSGGANHSLSVRLTANGIGGGLGNCGHDSGRGNNHLQDQGFGHGHGSCQSPKPASAPSATPSPHGTPPPASTPSPSDTPPISSTAPSEGSNAHAGPSSAPPDSDAACVCPPQGPPSAPPDPSKYPKYCTSVSDQVWKCAGPNGQQGICTPSGCHRTDGGGSGPDKFSKYCTTVSDQVLKCAGPNGEKGICTPSGCHRTDGGGANDKSLLPSGCHPLSSGKRDLG